MFVANIFKIDVSCFTERLHNLLSEMMIWFWGQNHVIPTVFESSSLDRKPSLYEESNAKEGEQARKS